MRSMASFGVRCVGLGLLLLALGVALRWSWPAERAAVLLALHVTAMAVLTAGILGAKGSGSTRQSPTCQATSQVPVLVGSRELSEKTYTSVRTSCARAEHLLRHS